MNQTVPRLLSLLGVLTLASSVLRSDGPTRVLERAVDGHALGAPYPGVIPPSIWALAFSPDGMYLAAGVTILNSKEPPYSDHRSYLVILSMTQPQSPLRSIGLSEVPWNAGPLPNGIALLWSADGSHVVTSHKSLLDDNAYLLDVETGREHIVPRDNCDAVGLAQGPSVVMACSHNERPSIRLLNSEGKISAEWPIPRLALAAGFSPLSNSVALVMPDAELQKKGVINSYRQVKIMDVTNWTERGAWEFSGTWGWSGDLSVFGSFFCGQFYGDLRQIQWRNLGCWDVQAGMHVSGAKVNVGRAWWYHNMSPSGTAISIGGNRLVGVDRSPPGYRTIWELKSGRQLAQWKISTERIYPKKSWKGVFLWPKIDCPWALSPDGHSVADGCSGRITLYDLPK
jgi:hypothetical protein